VRGLLRLAKGIDAFTEVVGNVTLWFVPIVVAVGCWNVFNRYIGRAIGQTLGSNMYIEAQWYIFASLFFMGGAYALKHGEHVRVDVFYGNYSAQRKALVDFLGTLFFLVPFCTLLIYFSWSFVGNAWRLREMSPDPGGLPRYTIKTFLIISPSLLLIQAVSEAIKNLAVLTGHLKPEGEAKSLTV
jgi:TRAP-type mannitol/chloroaromatic compound transport system permease small subunit